ncbi:MAG: DEAD/DEAH box helicase [Aquabacterium sp.]|uniref:preprotein translocase subunit SecA n=1 Tax=Aquabacterium sp. TaxID=1872578 RepID=UPI003BB044BC
MTPLPAKAESPRAGHLTPHAIWSERIALGAHLPVPGSVLGAYPEREVPALSASPTWAWLQARWRMPGRPSAGRTRRFVQSVREAQARWTALAPAELDEHVDRLRAALSVQGFTDALAARAMGLVCLRVAQQRNWQVHDVQLSGAWWMLGRRLIEMATGEGKSLTVVLAAGVAALAGVPVHVMTANDYLARRDAEQWAALYVALGLRVSWITAASTAAERRLAYEHDVLYVTAKEVAFDHLRDRAARAQGQEGDVVLRGLCMTVIDEADSILIDEACTPLVLSQALPSRQTEQQHRLSLFLARQMQAGRDFEWRAQHELTWHESGQERLASLSANLQGAWKLKRYREEQVSLALTALHVLQRDAHYLLRDGEVHIIDGPTGRLAIGRAWSRGLHQMVCIKEGLVATPETETVSQTTYQEFFPRYHHVCGLSGTLWEERRELLAIYGLPVLQVPLKQPGRRQDLGMALCADARAKWALVAQRVARQVAQGRAVLVGTDTVADSERLSAVLQAQGLAHRVLNARHDGQEGEAERDVIEQAGLAGAITVATHMAGRGTDIHVTPPVLAQGGLHVVNTHLNASRRIDRQLYGRSARQGQPGSFECVLARSDDAIHAWATQGWKAWLLRVAAGDQAEAGALARALCGLIQHQEGRRAFWRRWHLLQMQWAMRRQLAWAGRDGGV